MQKIMRGGLLLTLSLTALACNPENKKPDAVVISNEEQENRPTATEEVTPDTTDLITSYQDTSIENYQVASARNSSPGDNKNAGDMPATATAPKEVVTATDRDETLTGAEKSDSQPATAIKTAPKVPVKPVVRTRLTVQQQLARDARLASQMPLAKFGRYMERRADYYRSFGEVSYEDKTVEIKITREELKIETPEGKYKRESDERKIKTDKGKVKEETRR